MAPDAIETLALACAGMPANAWNALLWRHLRDNQAWHYLYAQLVAPLRKHRSKLVQARADLIARLVLAEEQVAVDEWSSIGHVLLNVSRPQWSSTLRPAFMVSRAQLDGWARRGVGMMRRKVTGR